MTVAPELQDRCADPDINDNVCSLNWPEQVPQAHRDWINNYRASSYCQSDQCSALQAYPWTQLGYTYDWGNPVTEVGLSEFVIRQRAKNRVNRIVPTQAYCRS